VERIQALAKRQLADYDRHQPGALFAGGTVTITVEEAYALQHEVARLRQERGERIAGYKIGCASKLVQSQLGLNRPVFGHVFDTELRRSGAVLDSREFDGLAMEGEFAVRVAADIPDAAWLRTHPKQAISAAFAVIELHNYVFRDATPTAQELVGNNAMHAGVILPLHEPQVYDPEILLDEAISVCKNSDVLGAARGRDLENGPFGSIVWLAEHLSRFGRHLRRGQIVLTGSPLPLYPVAPGDRIAVLSKTADAITAFIS
jgi:2-keto-4-pentenoate hydratase